MAMSNRAASTITENSGKGPADQAPADAGICDVHFIKMDRAFAAQNSCAAADTDSSNEGGCSSSSAPNTYGTSSGSTSAAEDKGSVDNTTNSSSSDSNSALPDSHVTDNTVDSSTTSSDSTSSSAHSSASALQQRSTSPETTRRSSEAANDVQDSNCLKSSRPLCSSRPHILQLPSDGSTAGDATTTPDSSSSGRTTVAAAACSYTASNSTLPQYRFYGPPVCATCGDAGHIATGCSTRYCCICCCYGHATGCCNIACSTCGKVHDEPRNAECNNRCCSCCYLWGHVQATCPSVCCKRCGFYGHMIRECKEPLPLLLDPGSSPTAATAAVDLSHLTPGQIKLQRPASTAEALFWQQQLLSALGSKFPAYAALVQSQPHKLSCLACIAADDLALIVQLEHPIDFLDGIYRHCCSSPQLSQQHQAAVVALQCPLPPPAAYAAPVVMPAITPIPWWAPWPTPMMPLPLPPLAAAAAPPPLMLPQPPPPAPPPIFRSGGYCFHGPPACSRCGSVGHIAESCKVAACTACRRVGHTAANCSAACKRCDRVHASAVGCSQMRSCSYCGMFGHMAAGCPKAQCKKCGYYGHMAGQCREQQQRSSRSIVSGSQPSEADTTAAASPPADAGSSHGSAETEQEAESGPATLAGCDQGLCGQQIHNIGSSLQVSSSKYRFYGAPACSRCGGIGHTSESCRVAACTACNRVGHTAADCAAACKICDWVHISTVGCSQTGSCHYCGMFGHMAAGCPKARCMKCDYHGHMAGQCREQQQQHSSSSSTGGGGPPAVPEAAAATAAGGGGDAGTSSSSIPRSDEGSAVGMASAAAADCSSFISSGRYVFYGSPVCATCGLAGHLAEKCRVPLCASCSKYGHHSGECNEPQVCKLCGRRHVNVTQQQPQQCRISQCKHCGRWGHVAGQCPAAQCRVCGYYGHMAGQCKACSSCRQHGHAPHSCTAAAGTGSSMQQGTCPSTTAITDATAAVATVQQFNLRPEPGDAAEQQEQVAVLIHQLFGAGESEYAISLLQQQQQLQEEVGSGQQQGSKTQQQELDKLHCLARLPAKDLELILAEKEPTQLLDAVYEHHKQLQDQQQQLGQHLQQQMQQQQLPEDSVPCWQHPQQQETSIRQQQQQQQQAECPWTLPQLESAVVEHDRELEEQMQQLGILTEQQELYKHYEDLANQAEQDESLGSLITLLEQKGVSTVAQDLTGQQVSNAGGLLRGPDTPDIFVLGTGAKEDEGRSVVAAEGAASDDDLADMLSLLGV